MGWDERDRAVRPRVFNRECDAGGNVVEGDPFTSLGRTGLMVVCTLVTSLAFGLHHIALGIPFWPALGFSIGGFFFAIVKWRSESLFPPILLHFIINLLMVFSGFILPY